MPLIAKGIDIGPAASGLTLAKCQAIKAAGVKFVIRYLGTWPSGKGLTQIEFSWWKQVGMPLCFLYEEGATTELGGTAQGAKHALAARAELRKLGIDPANQPVIYCTDTDANEQQVDAYYEAIGAANGVKNTWAYGGHNLIKALFDKGRISGAYQSEAWSYNNGRWPTPPVWDSRAQLHQWSAHNNPGSVAGLTIDTAEAWADDFGQHPRPSAPRPTPTPIPPPPPAPTPTPGGSVATAEGIFTANVHRHLGTHYGWGHEYEFPVGNPAEPDADCSGMVFADYAETDRQVLALNGKGIPWHDGSRWYTDPTHNHRMTADGMLHWPGVVRLPRTGPFRVGDLFWHAPGGHAVHVGVFCHFDGRVWWTTEERNGCETHPIDDPVNGILKRYSADELIIGRFSWVDLAVQLPSPVPAPAPAPGTDLSKLPLLVFPNGRAVEVDGRAHCPLVKVVGGFLTDVNTVGDVLHAPIHYAQWKLTRLGFPTQGIDGQYGECSALGCRGFQLSKKIKADGEMNEQTWAALIEA